MKKSLLALSLLLLISSCLLAASERPIDPVNSKITIHVGKAGLFSAAGHEHEVSAPTAAGAIDDSQASHVWLRIEAAKLTVLPEKDQEAVQSTMQTSVMESAKFPEIRFESTSIRKIDNEKWTITGNLTLHGRTNSMTFDVLDKAGTYLGQARIKQTDFGIQPISVAGGTIKVLNEVKIDFVIAVGK